MPDMGLGTGIALSGLAGGGLGLLGQGLFGGGQQGSQSQNFRLTPEQQQLFAMQGQQYGAISPLATALAQGQASQIGVVSPGDEFRRRFNPRDVGQDLLNIKSVDEVPRPGDPRYAAMSAAIRQSPTFSTHPLAALLSGAPASAATVNELNTLGGELSAMEPNPATPEGLTPQSITYDPVTGLPNFEGGSSLARALQATLRLQPEEAALPGAISRVANPLADALRARTTQYQGQTADYQNKAELIRQLSMQVGPDVRSRLASITGQPYDTSTLRNAPLEGVAAARQSLDTPSMLFDINQQMERTILPEVRAAAIRAGHQPDVRSSGYSRLLGDVSRQYGGAVTQKFAENEMARRNALLNALGIQTQAEAAAGSISLQDKLRSIQAELGGSELGVKGLTLGQIAGQSGLEAGRTALEAERTTIPALYSLLMAGPQAEAQVGAMRRDLAGRAALTPLELIRSSTIQTPGTPTYPVSGSSTALTQPTPATSAGAGIGQGAFAGLLYSLMNPNKAPMDTTQSDMGSSILAKILAGGQDASSPFYNPYYSGVGAGTSVWT